MNEEETAPEMLSRLGTDGMLWAQEFNKTAVRLGYSEMDEDWLVGWFANAIENCDMIRCNPLRAENEKLRAALKPFVTAPPSDAKPDDYDWLMVRPEDIRAVTAALKETGDE